MDAFADMDVEAVFQVVCDVDPPPHVLGRRCLPPLPNAATRGRCGAACRALAVQPGSARARQVEANNR
eukprot:1052997-Lingulodinium_polyedra.AAC.1